MGTSTPSCRCCCSSLGSRHAEIAVWTGLLVAVMMATAMPLSPFWGVLAERYSRRPIIVRCYILLAIGLLIAAWADDVRWLILVRLLMGLSFGNGGIIIAVQALITPPNRLGSAIATVQASQPIAASLGPPLGALAIPFLGLRGLFVVDAAVTLVAALALWLLLPEPPLQAKRGSVLGRTGEVVGFVWKTPPIRWNFFSFFLLRGATSVVDAYLPVRITQLVADPAPAIGWILGIYGLMTTLATWLIGRLVDRTEAAVLYWRAMLLATLLTMGMALSPSIWLLGILAALRSIPVACSGTVLYAHATRILPAAEQTGVLGADPGSAQPGPARLSAVRGAGRWAGARRGPDRRRGQLRRDPPVQFTPGGRNQCDPSTRPGQRESEAEAADRAPT